MKRLYDPSTSGVKPFSPAAGAVIGERPERAGLARGVDRSHRSV
jgi:hypothetical protein